MSHREFAAYDATCDTEGCWERIGPAYDLTDLTDGTGWWLSDEDYAAFCPQHAPEEDWS